jgi:hypothetical protein
MRAIIAALALAVAILAFALAVNNAPVILFALWG